MPELRLETLEFAKPGREVEMTVWGRSTVCKGTEAIAHIQHYGHSKILGKAGAEDESSGVGEPLLIF